MRVNQVTPRLFSCFHGCLANADLQELENQCVLLGFTAIKRRIFKPPAFETEFGQVPQRMEQLLQLPGVARKTANGSRSCLRIHVGVTVDTHVKSQLPFRIDCSYRSDPD